MTAIRLKEKLNNQNLVIPYETLKELNTSEVEIIILPAREESARTQCWDALLLLKGVGKGVYGDVDGYVRGLRDEW